MDKQNRAFNLRSIYSDNMVLQRNTPIKIYGFAEANEIITGNLANNSATTNADQNGEFVLTFPAMEATCIPCSLEVKNSKNEQIKLENILIGEVYLASGQSNMEMPIWSNQPFWKSFNGEEEVKNANFPEIRFFLVNRRVEELNPVDDVAPAKWQVMSSQTAAPTSVVAYYFAKKLHAELQVPIGMIESYWGGTPIEPWISKDAFEANNDTIALERYDKQRAMLENLDADYPQLLADWVKKFHEANPNKQNNDWKNLDFDDSTWDKINLPGIFAHYPQIKQLRKTIEITPEIANKELTLSLGIIDDCDETYFDGTLIGKTFIDTPNYYAVPRLYTIPAALVKPGKAVIAIKYENHFAWGGFNFNDKSLLYLATPDNLNKINLSGEWSINTEYIADQQKLGYRPVRTSDQQQNWISTLYNGMIHPWIIYPIRGVIWYQGCSNGEQYERYMKLFPMLIENWRNKWQNPEMPFIFVQLSAFFQHLPAERGDENKWKTIQPLYASGEGYACIREVQAATLNIPHTGMAVSIDKGDQYDIHPACKQEVAERLAMEAMRLSFGKKEITASPYYQSMKIEGDKIRLTFTNADNGFVFAGDKINGFAIGDDDDNWQVADVEITNDNELLISAQSIKNPTRVRYAFCAYPGDLNLYNREGFPMCPFRTDKPDYLLK